MEGIENIEYKDIEIVDQLDYRIKLLGITEIINKQLFERVHPCLVKKYIYWQCKWSDECSNPWRKYLEKVSLGGALVPEPLHQL